MSSGGLRPLGIGEILDAAIKLYVRRARVLMGAAAAVIVPLQIVTGLVLLSSYSSGRDIPTGLVTSQIPRADVDARLGATAITSLVTLIATVIVTAACTKAVSDAYLDQPSSVGSSLRFAGRRFLPLIAQLTLGAIGLVIAFILLVIPGIWLYASWAVATPVLLIEGIGPIKALGRSRRLVKGRWWPTAGVLLLSNLIVTLASGVVTGLLTAIALQDSHPSVLFAVTITTAATIVSQTIVHPFSASVITVLYFDLRIRREGYDLQLMADQLGLPETALPVQRAGSSGAFGPEDVGRPGGPPFWPPPPGWRPDR
jgi:hypothetical protein